MKRKAKDVTPRGNAQREEAAKKSTDSLPKILRLASVKGSLQAQRVKCGKPNCRCARGELHEGYHYFFLKTPTRFLKFYVRREDVPAVRTVIADRVRRRRALRAELNDAQAFLRRMMSAAVGVKI